MSIKCMNQSQMQSYEPEYSNELLPGILTALISVEDLGLTIQHHSFPESLHTEGRIKSVGQAPGEYLTTVPVHVYRQVTPAPWHPYIGYIRSPDLIRPADQLPSEKIWIMYMILPWSLVFGRGLNVSRPIISINRRIRRRLVRSPLSCNSSLMRRAPKKGWAV